MRDPNPKIEVAILRVLQETRQPLGGEAIAKQAQAHGVDLSGRTVRLYLKQMEMKGLVGPAKRGRSGGRTITALGAEEVQNARVVERLGFTAARVDSLAWKMDFELASKSGNIVLNVTVLDENRIHEAVTRTLPVFEAGLGMGEYAIVARGGEWLGDVQIPEGKAGIGTVCSVTLNGVLLQAGIPLVSRFGGVLEMREGQPTRFTDVIYYDGTSLDPLEIFIKAGLTSVREATAGERGQIGVSFREFPTSAFGEVEQVLTELKRKGLGGILTLGKPNQPLLEFSVHEGRTAMIVNGGLNPVAVIEEAGIATKSHALCTLFEFQKLCHYTQLVSRIYK